MPSAKTTPKVARKSSPAAVNKAGGAVTAAAPNAPNTPNAPAARALAASAVGAVRAARAAAGPLAVAVTPRTDLISELNNIDFGKMIGGPLQAAVEAQVASSVATIDFINRIGFTEPVDGKRELVMVNFTHRRVDVDAEGNESPKETFIKVPLLAMLPIPSLRIEHVNINFNVKLNSVESYSTTSTAGLNLEAKGGFGPVKFKVSASYQRKTTSNVEVKKEYALSVDVKAVQDEIPPGLEKILAMLAA